MLQQITLADHVTSPTLLMLFQHLLSKVVWNRDVVVYFSGGEAVLLKRRPPSTPWYIPKCLWRSSGWKGKALTHQVVSARWQMRLQLNLSDIQSEESCSAMWLPVLWERGDLHPQLWIWFSMIPARGARGLRARLTNLPAMVTSGIQVVRYHLVFWRFAVEPGEHVAALDPPLEMASGDHASAIELHCIPSRQRECAPFLEF